MKRWLKDNRGFILFLLFFGLFRTAVADWNPIPSGSMRPTLLEGDVVFVNRLAYDVKLPLTDIVIAHLDDPDRGDIVTFSSPADGTRLIKRVVGIPGDVVEMRDEVLFINGEAARYSDPEMSRERPDGSAPIEALRMTEHVANGERRVQRLLGASANATFGPVVVPADSFVVLGDNRDNSADSRFFGFVPRRLLIGHAQRILVSADIVGSFRLRADRFGHALR